jgi:DNA-binding GntR family transcriptional regulator
MELRGWVVKKSKFGYSVFCDFKKINFMSNVLSPTPLHLALADRISLLIHEQGLAAGTRLNENLLADQLGVSRTPVRAALEHLAGRGFVARHRHRGVELVALPPKPQQAAAAPEDEDAMLLRIARDRQRGELADDVSEKELMDHYGLSRPALRQTLERLAELGLVERKLGYGWHFTNDQWDAAARHESYRFRMTIEPAAIREPSFALQPQWIDQMRHRHESFLSAPWTQASSIAFFEMNAAFHEGIAAGAGNRYFVMAMQRQNRLRRLSNYDWKHGRERVEVNCREHLEMLARLEAGDYELAALLMYRHLDVASRLRSAQAKTD